jgi:hypothetical protein
MVLRRALFYWQFFGALALPLWVLIGRGIVQADQGWDFVFYLVVCPVLCLVMLAVAGLTVARKAVRVSRAVSWQDAALLSLWHVSIITYGFLAFTGLAALVVVISIAAFWSAAWLLFSETRSRVREALSLGPIETGRYVADTYDPAVDAGRVIIINPDGSTEEPPKR